MSCSAKVCALCAELRQAELMRAATIPVAPVRKSRSKSTQQRSRSSMRRQSSRRSRSSMRRQSFRRSQSSSQSRRASLQRRSRTHSVATTYKTPKSTASTYKTPQSTTSTYKTQRSRSRARSFQPVSQTLRAPSSNSSKTRTR